jgi:hypothetical protein
MDTEQHPEQESERNKTDLMSRAAELFQEFRGPHWAEIVKELEGEGYLKGDDKALTSNALRKRSQKDPVLRRLLEDYRQGKLQPREMSLLTVPKEHLEKRPAPSRTRVKRDNIADHAGDTTVTAKEVLALLQGSMQRRDEILIEQIRQSNTGGDMGGLLQIEDRMVQKMNQEWGKIKEKVGQIEVRLEILVEDKVDENLKSMVTPEGSFAKDLESVVTKVIEKKFSGEAGTLLSALPMTPGQGPGRWEGEGKMARFSATMPQHLYDAMKGIKDDASFSARISAAVDFYLRALAAQGNNTEYDKEG